MKFFLFFLAFLNLWGCSKVLKSGPTLQTDESSRGMIVADATSSYGFGETRLDQSNVATLTLLFKGNGKFSAKSIRASEIDRSDPFQYKGGTRAFPGAGGTCEETLSASVPSCTIELELNVSLTGTYQQTYTIYYNDGISEKTIPFVLRAVVGNRANLLVEEDSINGGLVELSSTVTLTQTLTNQGDLSATNIQIADPVAPLIYKGGVFPGTGGNCKATLAPKESCDLVYQYTALAEESVGGNIIITYLDPNVSAQTNFNIFVTGAHIIPKMKFVNDFSSLLKEVIQDQTTDYSISIENYGLDTAKNVRLQVADPFSIVSTDCPTEMAVGDFCDYQIIFYPRTVNTFVRDVSLFYDDNFGVTHEVKSTLSGIGKAPAKLILHGATSPVSFGTIGTGTTKTVTFYLKNSGSSKATQINLPSLSAPFDISLTSCTSGIQLSPGNTCYINLRYSPVSPQNDPLTLSIPYFNGVSTATLDISVDGNALDMGLLSITQIPAFEYYYPSLTPDLSTDAKVFTLKNIGNADASNIAINKSASSYFSYTGGTFPGTLGTCSASTGVLLTPNATCDLDITYAPQSPGGDNELYLDFSYNNQYSNEVMSKKLVGHGYTFADILIVNNMNPPHIALNDTTEDLGFISQLLGDDSIIFYLRNLGELTAQNLTATLSDGSAFHFAGGSYPGTNGDCGNSLVINSPDFCAIDLEFKPLTTGIFNDTLTVTFSDASGSRSEYLYVTAESKKLAVLEFTSSASLFSFGNVVVNTTSDVVINIENSGDASATSVVASISSSFSIVSNGCGSTIDVGANCNLTVRFSPTVAGVLRTSNLDIDYFDNQSSQSLNRSMSGTGVNPADLVYSPVSPFNFPLTTIGTSTDIAITVLNGGEFPATNINFAAPPSPFSLKSHTCNATLDEGDICSATFTFTPTNIQSFSSTFSASFFNGKQTTSDTLTLKGDSQNVPSRHQGWREITAIGDVVDYNSAVQSVGFLRLSWNNMTSDTGLITGYQTFKRLSDDEYNFLDPEVNLLSGSGTTYMQTFSGAGLEKGTVYYFQVRPIINGYHSPLLSGDYPEIRIMVPSDNMVLVHRLMANREVCSRLALATDSSNFYRCNYTGLGHTNNKFDLGYDLLVDRFEMGLNQTAQTSQSPQYALNQLDAANLCDAQLLSFTEDSTSAAYPKRLPSRKEQLIYSLSSNSSSDSEIAVNERGALDSTRCNGNSLSTESTGANHACQSIFGVYDVAGNSWEWVSDRVISGFGVSDSQDKIDPANSDLDDADLNGFTENSLENYGSDCFSLVMGIPVKKVTTCSAAKGEVEFNDKDEIFFHEDYYIPPSSNGDEGLIVGGSYSYYPGAYTSAWISFYLSWAGARCVVPYSY